MNRRTRAALVALGTAAATVTALSAVPPSAGAAIPRTALAANATSEASEARAVDPASQEGLERTVSVRLERRLGARARASYGLPASAALRTLVEPQRWSPDRAWTFGSAVFLIPDGVDASPVTALFVARLDGGAWKAGLQGTPEFASCRTTRRSRW
ncbi:MULTISPECIES: hypothetical protein [Actinomadura]|uniref:Secreted protein n=1 Tax=Actinomadura yumaensis TaxID=111807 RepID=A0ABW2CZ78_9ACTN|nr:hypothetical protein [Actinomadura sp. J1-007]MWK39512.1 hypothetical protein [Actinomadura sp. J1-007]